MPQMSPMWWVFLNLFFIFSLFYLFCVIYFISFSFSFSCLNYKLNHFFWLW
nr:ATP synthase F0 subunit 8 [Petalocephala eurglobata]